MARILLIITFGMFFLVGCSSTVKQKKDIDIAHINAELGLAYLRNGQIEIAKYKLLVAFNRVPHDAKILDALGYFFAHTGEPYLAEQYYLQAMQYAQVVGDAWYNYGVFLYHQKRYQEALKYFLLATKDINYLFVAQAYVDASNVAAKLKKDELAKRCHQEALAHDPRIFSYPMK